jgi:hypothetical protein
MNNREELPPGWWILPSGAIGAAAIILMLISQSVIVGIATVILLWAALGALLYLK